MNFSSRPAPRRGTIVPLLAFILVALMTLVALAIDIGLLAAARNHAQNTADVAAMAGVRVLTGDAATDNNYAAVTPTAKAAGASNKLLDKPVTADMVSTEIGYYAYDSGLQRFATNFTGTKPASENWSAVRANVNGTQERYFSRVLGLTALPVTATATSVHRPRDIALILDYSASMQYASEAAWPSSGDYQGSLNPDPAFPKFGHWTAMAGVMQRTTAYVDGGGEVHGPTNLTVETDNGSAMVRDFLTRNSGGTLINAFHRPTAPYNSADCATPAPADWDLQADTTVTYQGDKWPRKKSTTAYGATLKEVLDGDNSTLAADHSKVGTVLPGLVGGTQFDPLLHDAPLPTEGYGPSFKGHSMGPGYYGKTFYVWPPDPRWTPGATPATPHATDTAKDSAGRYMADWRKRFFFDQGTGTPLGGNTAGADNRADNSRLWDGSGFWRQANSSSYSVNYNAIVAWLKSGPKVLPDNLRAGRVLYYSAIPDTIPASGGTEDQRFWRAYIDYVIGAGSATVQRQTMYGRQTGGWGTVKVTGKGNLRTDAATRPFMHYNDNPVRPRLHFWFGPLSMLTFLQANNNSGFDRNWLPGTCHESQCWQLKVGVSAALNDIQKNHPNDWVSLMYFSSIDNYGTARVPLGRDYAKLRNALFFPFNTLDNLADTNHEVRPYNSSFSSTASGNIPNALGGTSPEMGFKVAYNQFSGRPGFNGRRGASKVVILETDGVPNTPTNGGSANSTWQAGSPPQYNSWYDPVTSGSFIANADPTVLSRAKTAAQTICNLATASTPGYSTPKNPARIHTIAFGDLFQTTGAAQRANALAFLLDIQKIGNTSPPSATSIEPYKIVTGDYNTRIENMRQAFERIMQSGVQVSLIE